LLELHDKTAVVPDPEMVAGLGELHDSPVGTLSVMVTMPEKPFTLVTVIVELDDDPGGTVVGEVAETRKSWKLKMAVVV
jgi:hypothetical protein